MRGVSVCLRLRSIGVVAGTGVGLLSASLTCTVANVLGRTLRAVAGANALSGRLVVPYAAGENKSLASAR